MICGRCGGAVSAQLGACPACGLPAAPVNPLGHHRQPVGVGTVPYQAGAWAARKPHVVVGLLAFGIASSIVLLALWTRHQEAEIRERTVAVQTAERLRLQQNERDIVEAKQRAAKAADDQAAAVASIKERSGALSRAQRDTWIRDCFFKADCKQWKIDAMIDGAQTEAERDHARRVSFAASCAKIAKQTGQDGESLSAVTAGSIAGVVAMPDNGLAMLDLLDSTTIADAKKDPSSARGRALKVSGTIVEIRTEKSITEGALMTGGGNIIRFVTMMPSTGIYAENWASFVGVFVQEYAYSNVSGGQTKSLLAVGAFDSAENRRPAHSP